MRPGALSRYLALTLILALPACIDRLAEPDQVEEEQGEDDDDDGEGVSPVGTYHLVRVNGRSLPVEIHVGGGDEAEITSGRIEIAGSGACVSRVDLKVKKGGKGKKRTKEEAWIRKCGWSRNGGTLRLRWEGGGEQVASWSGREIDYAREGMRYLFRRD